MLSHRLSLLFLTLFVFVAAGCGAPAPQFASANVVESLSGKVDASFARAYDPVPFVFPQDHGAHDAFSTEWWYYTGNLRADNGDLYGYQLTFFRSALSAQPSTRTSDFAANQVYMAHFAITSGSANQHTSYDRFSRGSAGLAGAQGDPQYAVWLEDWRAQQIGPDQYRLTAAVADAQNPMALDLVLTETQPPLLHGEQGLSQKGAEPGNASYYYSLVRMETQGTLTIGGATATVGGHSWMDHEFGSSALSGDALGWDWFSATLDDGTVLMFAEIRTQSGESQEIFEGTLALADGRQFVITQDDFELTALDQWTSPKTNITYPSGWQVRFAPYAIDLTIRPLIQDQEMDVAFTYYEGATLIEGSHAGAAVTGRGYVELTGYGADAGSYQR